METFIKNFAEVLECDPGSLKPETQFRDCKTWDSLALLSTMAMIDENYQVVIPQKEFAQLKTVSEIFAYISRTKS